MNDFQDIAALLTSTRDRMGETVQDRFGDSFIADVFDPMLSEANGLASLCEEVKSSMNAADRVIVEARSIGGLESR